MFYAKAGYTNQRFGLEGSDGTASASQRLDTDGYRLGVGAEYAFSGNVYGGLEYRYSNYRKGEFDFNDPDLAADKKRAPPVMAPMHKVTSLDGVAVCGVDETGTVACRVDDHGFVITPTETKVF